MSHTSSKLSFSALLLLSAALLSGTALAQQNPAPVTITPESFKALLTPETWAVIVFWVAGWITSPLTALIKKMWNTSGVTTERTHAVLVAFLTGIFPLMMGAYGYTALGVLYAVLVVLLRILVDRGNYDKNAQQMAKGMILAESKIVEQVPDPYREVQQDIEPEPNYPATVDPRLPQGE